MRTWPIIGHEWAVRQLQMALMRDDVPHALLITGAENGGKMTLAHTLTQALLCTAPPEDRPCGACLACRKVESGNHPDVMSIGPEEKGRALKIEYIREVESFLALTPKEGAHKVALVRNFELATIGAANALLKTLEEPPAYAHLILMATNTESLLPTIVSRSQQINLRPLAKSIIEQALIERWELASEKAERLARIAGGRLGWAVRAATETAYLERMEDAVETLLNLLHQDIPARFEMAASLAKDDAQLADALEYWLAAWRDVLLIQTNNLAAVTYREHQSTLQTIAQRVDVPITVDVLEMLEEAQVALQKNANTQLLTENVILTLPHLPELKASLAQADQT